MYALDWKQGHYLGHSGNDGSHRYERGSREACRVPPHGPQRLWRGLRVLENLLDSESWPQETCIPQLPLPEVTAWVTQAALLHRACKYICSFTSNYVHQQPDDVGPSSGQRGAYARFQARDMHGTDIDATL